MHGSNFDHVPSLLTLQDSVSSSSGHASNVEKLSAVYHVVVCEDSRLTCVSFRAKLWTNVPSLRATHTPFASTWKQRLPSSSHSVAVTRGFMPGGAICPLVSNGCEAY